LLARHIEFDACFEHDLELDIDITHTHHRSDAVLIGAKFTTLLNLRALSGQRATRISGLPGLKSLRYDFEQDLEHALLTLMRGIAQA
jgi:hypothetical protein